MRKNNALSLQNQNNKQSILLKNIYKYKIFYLFALPGMLYITIFKILPIFGMVMSFQIYIPWQGFLKSEWIGLANFKDMFTSDDFYMRLKKFTYNKFLQNIIRFSNTYIICSSVK